MLREFIGKQSNNQSQIASIVLSVPRDNRAKLVVQESVGCEGLKEMPDCLDETESLDCPDTKAFIQKVK